MAHNRTPCKGQWLHNYSREHRGPTIFPFTPSQHTSKKIFWLPTTPNQTSEQEPKQWTQCTQASGHTDVRVHMKGLIQSTISSFVITTLVETFLPCFRRNNVCIEHNNIIYLEMNVFTLSSRCLYSTIKPSNLGSWEISHGRWSSCDNRKVNYERENQMIFNTLFSIRV